ncbi:MAG: metal-dependent hydrolase [Chloroflexi bacterium]|nr:metal-dependent hydrolase [Chloroflexota bacterium]
MSVSFKWLGHSAFFMEIDRHPVVFDPFLNGNPLAAARPEDLDAELLFLSHGHGDHIGDTIAIAKRTGAKVICNFEVGNWLLDKGVPHVHQGNPGGGFDHGFLHAKFTVAFHSSSMPDGSYGGVPHGFLITSAAAGKRIYYAGDTALFSDMQLIGQRQIDIAFLPIGDNFTMGPSDSIQAIKWLRPRYVFPMHYNTFDMIAQNAGEWANHVSRETDSQPIVLDPGGVFTLP